jgi:type I restriction enzyme M protein
VAEAPGGLSLRQLEEHLWGAAELLRGSIDAADYKHYIFSLLFYKRLSDVLEEQMTTLPVQRAGDLLRFQLPDGVSWRTLRQQEGAPGLHLDRAFRALERANPSLDGVFCTLDFRNALRFSDDTLIRLLRHFDRVSLRLSHVDAEVLGQAYEYLVARFADDAGRHGGEFYTPRMVVRLMVRCLQPEEHMSIYDPSCGAGGMLLETAALLKRQGHDIRTLRLYGQEKNLNTWAICRMNLFLHGLDPAAIVQGDTLTDPGHVVPGDPPRLMQFERVLANPPFSLKAWGYERWVTGDRYGRDVYGCPPKGFGDFAFIQHMLASLAPRGILGVVLPHGVLFRGGAEGRIRRALLEADLVDAVIGLAHNLFYGASIPAAIVILRRVKPVARRGQVLFIDASREYTEGRSRNQLTAAHVDRIAGIYQRGEASPGFSALVPLEELRVNDFNLTISRYVAIPSMSTPDSGLEEALQAMEQCRKERDAVEARVLAQLRGWIGTVG